ncbi:MAG: O-antigen ligase family protein [Gemmatimonadaceae bacterium]|nr:O-antigen ligase family protein [Gemmatimonadaceae bacterium]
MSRSAMTAPMGAMYSAARPGSIIPVGPQQMTVALFGLAIYLFCVHSFKLPIASVGIGIGLIGVLSNPKTVSFPAPLLWMAAFLAWSALGLTLSPYTSEPGYGVVDFLKILLILFVAINSAKTSSQLAVMMGLWVLMFSLYPARGTYFNFLAGISTFGRYGWNFSFENFNDLAAYTIFNLAMAGFLLTGRFPKWVKTSALVACGGFALLIVITQSRGAFLGVVVAFAFMLFRSRSRAKLIRFAGLAALGIALMAPGAVWERFSRMKFLLNTDTISEADSSAEQRWVLLQIASTIAREHLATGVGLGAYSEAHGVYAEERQEWQFGRGNRDAHNMYVSLVAETGLPGLGLFLAMLGSTLLRALRTERALRTRFPIEAEQIRILRFGLIAYLISATFGSFHRVSFLYLYLAVLWSATLLAEQLLSSPGGVSGAIPDTSVKAQLPRRGAFLRRYRTTLPTR